MRNGLTKTKKAAIGAAMVLGSLGIGGAGLALVNGGSAGAATSTSTPSTAAPNGTKAQKLRRYLRRHTVQATITVKTKNGYETFDIARGTVESISGSSITVASPNGATLTASITSVTRFHNTTDAQLATGDRVGLIARDGIARLVNAPKPTTTAGS